MDGLRKSVIAGSWYPGDPSVLRKDIQNYFKAVPDLALAGEIVALIAPHAGYIYSGQIAAYAYKLICGKKYDVVFVIGPSHRVAFSGVSIYSSGGYETPLGVVSVNRSVAHAIKDLNEIINELPAAHLQEHSLEIQLPFLQVALGNFSFVPLVMGDQNENTCRKLAAAIHHAAKDRKILIVASSDLSHFHAYDTAKRLDQLILRHLQESNAAGLMETLAGGTAEACGGGPMAVAILAAQMFGANKAHLLKYANSGDVTGDKSSVVGYASAVYYR